MAEKKCPVCHGRGYLRCECWPGDCICGQGDEDCFNCDGVGFIDPDIYPDEDDEYPEGCAGPIGNEEPKP